MMLSVAWAAWVGIPASGFFVRLCASCYGAARLIELPMLDSYLCVQLFAL